MGPGFSYPAPRILFRLRQWPLVEYAHSGRIRYRPAIARAMQERSCAMRALSVKVPGCGWCWCGGAGDDFQPLSSCHGFSAVGLKQCTPPDRSRPALPRRASPARAERRINRGVLPWLRFYTCGNLARSVIISSEIGGACFTPSKAAESVANFQQGIALGRVSNVRRTALRGRFFWLTGGFYVKTGPFNVMAILRSNCHRMLLSKYIHRRGWRVGRMLAALLLSHQGYFIHLIIRVT